MNLIEYTTCFGLFYKKLYHTTTLDSIPGIMKDKAIKGSKTLDQDSITKQALNKINVKDNRELVYLGRKKSISSRMGYPYVNRAKVPVILTLKIPKKDFKSMKRVYDNPEFEGLSKKDWINKVINDPKAFPNKPKGVKRLIIKHQIGNYYDTYSGKKGSGTIIIEGDIPRKYIHKRDILTSNI